MTEPASRPTVLVLDDEKNIRRSIELALEQEGFQVITAPDVSSALRTLHERIVEVLIIDIQLGEIDGITFFRKTQADGFSIPAIFISGHATLTQAAHHVVPVAVTAAEQVERLRSWASGRCLSASTPGVYRRDNGVSPKPGRRVQRGPSDN